MSLQEYRIRSYTLFNKDQRDPPAIPSLWLDPPGSGRFYGDKMCNIFHRPERWLGEYISARFARHRYLDFYREFGFDNENQPYLKASEI